MQETWGWNFPAVNRRTLSRVPNELAEAIRQRAPADLDEPSLAIVKEARTQIELLTPKTTQYIWNGNGQNAVPAYLATLSCVRSTLEPIIGWQAIRDINMFPAKMARRLRSFQAALDQIAPNKEELERQISLINEATSAAESLPTDLEALAGARKKIEELREESLLSHGKIAERLTGAESASGRIAGLQDEASKLVVQCEEAYRITTTKGLAAAFEQRAKSLSTSMWVWVAGLVMALGVGYFLGANRLEVAIKALNSSDPQKGIVWINGILALFSFGAPIWLGWMATKQIGQRFRLAEDYGFKASVAKAYEGYRKEAARIDPSFEARLFSSALTRLEEHPLRLVEEKTPGSPWHEFAESEPFAAAFKAIPGFGDEVKKLQSKLPVNGVRSVEKHGVAE